jgi:[acyl-carrier-protein] S-malonyltransferase
VRVGLFPGQGIPAGEVLDGLGQGDRLVDAASEILGYDLRSRVEVSARRRSAALPTVIAQPAIFTAGVISWTRSSERGEPFDYLAGHSLGEYTALVASGAMSFEHGLDVVKVRAEVTSEAGKATEGDMVAVLGLEVDQGSDIASRAGVELANDNAPGQFVLAGDEPGLARAAALAREVGGRTVLLRIGGSFHTKAMAPALEDLEEALARVPMSAPQIPVISNVTAQPHGSGEEIKRLLGVQLTSLVRWRESLEWLWRAGTRDFEDFGPGSVVGGLAKKTFQALRREAARGEAEVDAGV